ncbi:helix-turn-helix domain-containing protein [Clostridium sp. M62/1]|uniref:helix-turn-helix domain-containing protein n=1 Tax=Clostridium sp. M62/1 TaxID=411486 RepID=UPI0001973D7E|nr:helix-turn-helix domain-containing protein [Clostridium sp. M62/1]EFE14179.1 DNA binding domain, excisionase family [Clostridium sp. M62/1]UEB79056.1 helix-turn-helix domain-containing protein [Clostridium sp. M62/1]
MFEEKIAEMNRQTEAMQVQCTSEKRTYTVDEIQDILGISQPTAYALIKKNLFHSIRIGRNIRVSKASFDAWLDNQI